jgi:hypothetical protein
VRIFDVRDRCLKLGLAFLGVVWIAGCGAPFTALERLDERAGLMLSRAGEALVFARTERRYSRSGRDYLYIGPVEVNRQGVREYFLWVGVASTLDRAFIAAPAAAAPRTLVIVVDGEPLELPLLPWHELVRTSEVRPVYATAVPLSVELGARVTLQQLALFDRAPLEAVAVETGGGTPRSFGRWGGSGFGDFVAARARR